MLLDAIFELHPIDDLGQEESAIEALPIALGCRDQLEDHGEGGGVRHAAFGANGAMADE